MAFAASEDEDEDDEEVYQSSPETEAETGIEGCGSRGFPLCCSTFVAKGLDIP